ncbi:MAG: type IV toxin-antitoxin system AbiEi family antitoxin domain-containing protein [Dehalococcoidia bacterium]
MTGRTLSATTARVLELAERMAVIRPRDIGALGIAPKYLDRLYRAGRLQRVGRGLYTAAYREPIADQMLAEACTQVPRGVICLVSALRFHEIGTQNPFEIWMAIPGTAWKPVVASLPLRLVRFSGAAFSAGVEHHDIDGVRAQVYSPAKTVVDCFKFRNKIGLDVALEALREVWRQRRVNIDELWEYADICRVQNVMRPYLESLT